MKTHDVASIVLVNPKGLLIFQKRDNKPSIRYPGMITVWGGAVEDQETPLQAALREIKEETNLAPSLKDFEFIGEYPRKYKINELSVICYIYILRNIDETSLQVFEGQGYVLVDPHNEHNPDRNLYANLTNELLVDLVREKFV